MNNDKIESALAESLLEFLEAAVHTVLKGRNVYNPSLFDNRRLYGITVSQCRHPDVCSYIGTVLGNLKVGMSLSLPYLKFCALPMHANAGYRYLHSAGLHLLLWPCMSVSDNPELYMQPLLVKDTLQELLISFYDSQGTPTSKVSFIIQVTSSTREQSHNNRLRAYSHQHHRIFQGFNSQAQLKDWSVLEPSYRSALLKLHFSDNLLQPLPEGVCYSTVSQDSSTAYSAQYKLLCFVKWPVRHGTLIPQQPDCMSFHHDQLF